jgi:uncharacterized protein (TIGR02594 family)
MNRRTLLQCGSASAVVLGISSRASGQQSPLARDDGLTGFGFIGPEDDPTFGSEIAGRPQSGTALGEQLSRHEEVAIGIRLLFNAPRNVGQITVARYFEAITQKNRENELYRQEWKTRSNPMVVGFFSMTNTKPAEGDGTSWCSAFVSFCLFLANKENRFSALSGAYRDYGEPTGDPRPGDLVVFRKYGTPGRQGFGHIGFFAGTENGQIRVLGGNQEGGTGIGAIRTATFARRGDLFELDSFRRVP